MSVAANSKRPKRLDPVFDKQIDILEILSKNSSNINLKEYHIEEIVQMSGSLDEREIQRCLYVLEGQKLVAPMPPGDFTSKRWHITSDGLRVLSSFGN